MRPLMLCMGLGAIIAAVTLATGAEAQQSTPMPMKPPPMTINGTAVTTRGSSFAPTQITCSGVANSANSIACPPAQGSQRIGQPGDNY